MGNNFGGLWTKKKLNILESYLIFYMQALKNIKVKKVYIDCFAGSGNIRLAEKDKLKNDNNIDTFEQVHFGTEITQEDIEEIKGSVRIALDLKNKFDKYYFIEKEDTNIEELQELKKNTLI